MNKAFTKEEDGSTPPNLPDLPLSPHPNHVTQRGLQLLRDIRSTQEVEVARLRANRDFLGDLYPLAIAERDLRYTEARLASAILTEPAQGPLTKVCFGADTTVEDENGVSATYRIVGEDEAEPRVGLISAHSPLARALLEAGIGDVVDWVKPGGTVELEVMSISAPAP